MPHQTKQDITTELVKGLPDYYPSDDSSNNYALLEPVGEALRDSYSDLESIDYASTVQDEMAPPLTVPINQTHVIRDNETVYRDEVIVSGTLVVDGTLYAKSVTVQDGGVLTGTGTVTGGANLEEFTQRLEALGQLVGVDPHQGETVSHYRARVIAEYSIVTCEGTIEDVVTATAQILGTDVSEIQIDDRAGPGEVAIFIPVAALEDIGFSDSELAEVLEKLIPASYAVAGIQRGTFTYITPSEYDSGIHDESAGYDGLDTNGDPKDTGGTYAGIIE